MSTLCKGSGTTDGGASRNSSSSSSSSSSQVSIQHTSGSKKCDISNIFHTNSAKNNKNQILNAVIFNDFNETFKDDNTVQENVIEVPKDINEAKRAQNPGHRLYKYYEFLHKKMDTVKYTNASGDKRNVLVHCSIAKNFKEILDEILAKKFPIYSLSGFFYRKVGNGDPNNKNLSIHSYGFAVDINALHIKELPSGVQSKLQKDGINDDQGHLMNGYDKVGNNYKCMENAPEEYKDGTYTGYIRNNTHPVVQIFAKHGWGWGGNYRGGHYNHDYMHFSIFNGS